MEISSARSQAFINDEGRLHLRCPSSAAEARYVDPLPAEETNVVASGTSLCRVLCMNSAPLISRRLTLRNHATARNSDQHDRRSSARSLVVSHPHSTRILQYARRKLRARVAGRLEEIYKGALLFFCENLASRAGCLTDLGMEARLPGHVASFQLRPRAPPGARARAEHRDYFLCIRADYRLGCGGKLTEFPSVSTPAPLWSGGFLLCAPTSRTHCP